MSLQAFSIVTIDAGGSEMKVVLFCGGYGMRLREFSESIPKPMVPIGYRPMLWHVMKYYAHFGHKEFILCLGWQANVIKEYFLNYDECASNDFVLAGGGGAVRLLSSDIQDWNITFVDTGISSNIGERLRRVQPLLAGETTFLANYTDGLSDVHLPTLIDFHRQQRSIATFASVRPSQSFHAIGADEDGRVRTLTPIGEANVWMNGGFFVFDQEIFSWMKNDEELVVEPFQRLAAAGRLATIRHEGFWSCMDTYKEKQLLDERVSKGDMPWEIWNIRAPGADPTSAVSANVEDSRTETNGTPVSVMAS
jgi:glucose-1-phosphate cytidylyltransferase